LLRTGADSFKRLLGCERPDDRLDLALPPNNRSTHRTSFLHRDHEARWNDASTLAPATVAVTPQGLWSCLRDNDGKRTVPSDASSTPTLTKAGFENEILADQAGRSLTDRA